MIDQILNFLTGSVAGMAATTVVQPIDMIKVRVQIAGEASGNRSPMFLARQLIKNEGFFALYKGLDAGLMRQLV